jgi:hypothetical protein
LGSQPSANPLLFDRVDKKKHLFLIFQELASFISCPSCPLEGSKLEREWLVFQ